MLESANQKYITVGFNRQIEYLFNVEPDINFCGSPHFIREFRQRSSTNRCLDIVVICSFDDT